MNGEYYIIQYDMKLGPFTYEELIKFNIEVNTLVMPAHSPIWEEAGNIPELATYFGRRGVHIPTKSNVASFWWRLLAYIIDAVLIEAAMLLLFYQLVLHDLIDWHSRMQLFACLLVFQLILIFYNTIFEASFIKGSIGKGICRLAVVDIDGKRPGLYNAFKRNVYKLLSRMLFYLGCIRVLWAEDNQAWHDEFAKTYVVKRLQAGSGR